MIKQSPLANLQMTVLQVFLVIIIAVKATEGRRPICSPITQFTVVDPNKPHAQRTCRECPKCPPGQGLPIQCGSIVKNGTDTNCKPCEANKTYSKNYDSSTCKPCNLCGLKNIIQHCTPQQNRKCGTSCPPKHFLDEHDDCTQCYFCCADVPEHYRLKKCKDLGMPQNLQCQQTHENELCKDSFHQTTTNLPVTTATTTLNTKMVGKGTSPIKTRDSSNWSHPITIGVTSKSPTNSDTTTSLQMERGIEPSPSEEETHKADLIVSCSIPAIIVIVLIIVALVIYRQRFSRFLGFTEVTTDDTDIALIPKDVNLSELPYKVEKLIYKLDGRSRGISDWYDVGRKLGVPVEDLKNAEIEYNFSTGSPTKVLIEILCTKYSLNLQKFVTALQEVGRNDIAKGICVYYRNLLYLTTDRSKSSSTVESCV